METPEVPLAEHSSKDPILGVLLREGGVLADLVGAYPGSDALRQAPNWLDDWFRRRVIDHLPAEEATPPALVVGPTILPGIQALGSVEATGLRIQNLKASYFRGFRAPTTQIDLSGDLVVIDGPNSSGKTSLAEAMEWLFTGELQRRVMQEQGNARELEACIQNQLRPSGQETWVEARFARPDSSVLTLKRVLVEDYGTAATSTCESTLEVDDAPVPVEDEAAVLDRLFGGLPPLLMQHTLRQFVHSTPTARRQYFERLLSLDQLTGLIEKAVIGNARLKEFPSPTGSAALAKWEQLVSTQALGATKAAARKAATCRPAERTLQLTTILVEIARREFAAEAAGAESLEGMIRALETAQEITRQSKLPILGVLKPKRQLDERTKADLSGTAISDAGKTWGKAQAEVVAAVAAGKAVTAADREVSRAVDLLIAAGLVEAGKPLQICPVCLSPDAVTHHRLSELSSVKPLNDLLAAAQRGEVKARLAFRQAVESLEKVMSDLAPNPPTEKEWADAITLAPPSLAEALQDAKEQVHLVAAESKALREALASLGMRLDAPVPLGDVAEIGELLGIIGAQVGRMPGIAHRLNEVVRALDGAVGTVVSGGERYAARSLWLAVGDAVEETVADLNWERSKTFVQAELAVVRDVLMEVRQQVLESRRTTFSSEMADIWATLRADRYSVFTDLTIPPPRGKGFPVEIQVKARLDDGTQVVEVDALRVFSESQVNVLGIAAFVTRSALLGHSFVVFDDPVQSMDEEHFRTFAGKLVPLLLDRGIQVLVLTHNDTFARDLSFANADRAGYVTLAIRHSRRKGTVLEEGNRRVTERLARADHLAEDGRLSDAWKLVRLALERLYTLARAKHGPSDFDPRSWATQSAESMWEGGAGAIIGGKVPDSSGRLKDILDCSAAGAHDKPPRGLTDLVQATSYIRALSGRLQIGG